MSPRWGFVSLIVRIADFTEDAEDAEGRGFCGFGGFLKRTRCRPAGAAEGVGKDAVSINLPPRWGCVFCIPTFFENEAGVG